MTGKQIFSIIIAGLLLFMTSCYSNYISLSYRTFYGAQWNNDSSKVAFIASTKAYQQAKGITRFPDGGRPKYLIDNIDLYLFDTESMELTKLVAFNDLRKLMRNCWHAEIFFRDSIIYYEIKPTTDWEFYLKQAKKQMDSSAINALRIKYTKNYSVNIQNGNLKIIDTLTFSEEKLKKQSINLTDLNKRLKKVSVAQWGLKIKEIAPHPDGKYINDLIYIAKDGSPLTKRAIIEQIVSKMSNKEKRSILKAMDDHRNSLQGVEKMEYEIYSKESYKLIRELL
jgi:hypothetical protein